VDEIARRKQQRDERTEKERAPQGRDEPGEGEQAEPGRGGAAEYGERDEARRRNGCSELSTPAK